MEMAKRTERTTLPKSFIAFILEHLDEFEARVEGDSIVVTFEDGRALPKTPKQAPALSPQERPRFVYRVTDKAMTPEKVERFFSEQRLKVYEEVYLSRTGILAKELITKTKLPHGTVQQILSWLRSRKFVEATPEAKV